MADDLISLGRLALLHPAIRQDAVEAYTEACRLTPKGVHPFIDETVRTFKRSTALFNQPFDGIDNDGDKKIDEADEKVSNSKAGQSYHNYGLALDFHLQINGKDVWDEKNKHWLTVVNCFKKRGFEWGGDWKKFKDYPHLEKRMGYHWSDLLAKHDKNDYIPGNIYVNV